MLRHKYRGRSHSLLLRSHWGQGVGTTDFERFELEANRTHATHIGHQGMYILKKRISEWHRDGGRVAIPSLYLMRVMPTVKTTKRGTDPRYE